MASARARNVRARDYLARLRLLSVHGDAFFIWHRGPFGTVNGCRIGRLPGLPTEWTEINAALGNTALLLSVLAARTGYSFQRHRILPMGSFSRIGPTAGLTADGSADRNAHELFFDGRLFAQRRLNGGLKALAQCVAEFGDYAQAQDRSFRLPYAILQSGEKVADLHVTMGSGSSGSRDPQWTRAMKLLLIDLKWLLAWTFRQEV
jgi:beclin 1